MAGRVPAHFLSRVTLETPKDATLTAHRPPLRAGYERTSGNTQRTSSAIRWLTAYALSDALQRFAIRLAAGQPRAKLRGTARGTASPSSASG
jgi:hypothetical protein